ncbi:hypothetical protein BT96DRAFT_423019 [Gymnopus androsaceus JB14]|uniref:Uncharacterized protein n=1 Tax=Gymnopus androsaceus JB14 TaxID=1447944 RepID=A0A6A4GTD5_9AGAR|nr:hypothetical protein BT96DRAFT_423019 [Gymnopus androsaceus JB14]
MRSSGVILILDSRLSSFLFQIYLRLNRDAFENVHCRGGLSPLLQLLPLLYSAVWVFPWLLSIRIACIKTAVLYVEEMQFLPAPFSSETRC